MIAECRDLDFWQDEPFFPLYFISVGSGMIYSGSGSRFEFSEFRIRIQAKVPDPWGFGSNLY